MTHVLEYESLLNKKCYLVIWGEKFQDSVVAKGFFVQPAKTGTVTWEQLVVMFSPLTLLYMRYFDYLYYMGGGGSSPV